MPERESIIWFNVKQEIHPQQSAVPRKYLKLLTLRWNFLPHIISLTNYYILQRVKQRNFKSGMQECYFFLPDLKFLCFTRCRKSDQQRGVALKSDQQRSVAKRVAMNYFPSGTARLVRQSCARGSIYIYAIYLKNVNKF